MRDTFILLTLPSKSWYCVFKVVWSNILFCKNFADLLYDADKSIPFTEQETKKVCNYFLVELSTEIELNVFYNCKI